MVARLRHVVVHGSTRSLHLPLLLASDSSRLSDVNNTASEASIVGVSPRLVRHFFRVVRCTRFEGDGATQPPARARFGGRHCLPPSLRRSELA